MAATVLDYEPDIMNEKVAANSHCLIWIVTPVSPQEKLDPWNRIPSRNWALHSLPSATTR